MIEAKALWDRFAEGSALGVHPAVRAWFTADELLANASAWIAPELRLVGDLDAARAFAAAHPVEGATPADYANRVTDLGDGRLGLAGIRRGSATKRFFVDLVAVTRPFASPAELTATARRLGAEFAVFDPASVRTFAGDEALASAARPPGDLVLAARVADLRALAASSSDAVTLRPAGATVAYDHYLRVYREFHAEAPRNAELAHVEDIETLARFEADRGLFEVRVDGFFAGYCAARRWSRYGVRGWVGGEIILNRRFRGRGHAADVHRRLAEAIPAAPGDAIWAEVHEDNVPSWKAGLSAGYVRAGRVLFVPV